MNNNKLKHQTLKQIGDLVDDLSSKLAILEALDEDSTCSGSYDLNDQLYHLKQDLEHVGVTIARSQKIVPDEHYS